MQRDVEWSATNGLGACLVRIEPVMASLEPMRGERREERSAVAAAIIEILVRATLIFVLALLLMVVGDFVGFGSSQGR